MLLTLAFLLFLFNFLYRRNARLARPPLADAAVSDDGDNNNDLQDRFTNLNNAANSLGPQTPDREWLSSGDETQLHTDLEKSTEARSVNAPVPQTPFRDSELSDEGSDHHGYHPNINTSANTPVPWTPYGAHDSDGQKILFFDLDKLNANSDAETDLYEIVPSTPGKSVDLNSGTMLITSLSDTNNNTSRKIEFRASPLRGKHDVVLVYTAAEVLAARIPTTCLEASRASIEGTIAKLLSLAESNLPSPKTISWLQTQWEVWRSEIPPIKVYFIMTNNDGAVIRGSRIPNGIPRNTYTVFSGRFCSVPLAFDEYFELKERDITNIGFGRYTTGEFTRETHRLNGERELLITCPRRAQGLEGGIFVKNDNGKWKQEVTLDKVGRPVS